VGDLNRINYLMNTPSLGDAEPTLVEKLRQIADAKQGEPAPTCLCGGEPWAVILAQIAKDAADALERAKEERVVVHARHPVGYTVRQLICTSDAPHAPDFDAISGQFLPPSSKHGACHEHQQPQT
jgi:hypothetical protein